MHINERKIHSGKLFFLSLSVSLSHTQLTSPLFNTHSLSFTHTVSLLLTPCISHTYMYALSYKQKCTHPVCFFLSDTTINSRTQMCTPCTHSQSPHAHPHSNLYQYITFTHMHSSSLFFFPIQARCVKIKMYLSECHQKTSHFSISINQYNTRLHFDTSPSSKQQARIQERGRKKKL